MPSSTRNTLLRLLPDWIIGAFCLAIPALYNSFPMVTSDSGAYINNGFTLQVPLDRPLLYSIIIRVCSLGISLWGVIAFQVAVLSVLMQFIAERILGPAYSRSRFTAVMFLIGVCSSAGWFAGQLMPDIYTAMLMLAVLALWFGPESRLLRWALYAIILGSIMVHNSNLLIALSCGLLLLIPAIKTKQIHWKRIAGSLIITSVIGWIGLSSMNAIAGRKFSPSGASHVFLMCRMVENGMMDNFLDQYCPTDSASYKLCRYRNKLPKRQWDFMWDEKGALYETGGWEANEEEYNRIIRKTLTTPKYIVLHIVKAAQGTLRQLPLIYVGDGLFRFDNASNPQSAIYNHFKREEKEFNSSEQQVGNINFSAWNMLILAFSVLTITAALFVWPKNAQTRTDPMVILVCLTILFIIVNAAVTATFATVIGRYESRIFWILPFLSILQLIRCLDRGFTKEGIPPQPDM